MVRFATQLLQAGRSPFTAWYPYLGLGSPQFVHYQSLPALVTGAVGLLIGANAAFHWTIYILIAVWPIAIYCLSRLMGFSAWAAGCSAAMAPFLSSAPHIGYEQLAYIWVGYGVWTQLWASLTLPLAWGFVWRAVSRGRSYAPAVGFVSLTAALHFETGYLAVLPVLIWPFIAGRPVGRYLLRAALVISASLLALAWLIIPLLQNRAWASINEVLRGSPLENGYGAARVLGWFFSGQVLDDGRFPVLTVLTVGGLGLLCARSARSAAARAVLAVLVGCLLLSFGRTTFGSLVGIIPGSPDLFFRRFMMGVQLAALVAAGVGAEWFGHQVWDAITPDTASPGSAAPALVGRTSPARFLVAAGALVVALSPAWLQAAATDEREDAAVRSQRASDAAAGREVNRLLDVAAQLGPGRVYAGTPSNWGARFRVGAVPVFKYLASRNIDEVGFTLRTASLMTDPEYYFDESNPSDYELFAIRYLILPEYQLPPVTAKYLASAGPYSLWMTSQRGYLRLGTLAGDFDANRADVGVQSIRLLRSTLTARGGYLRVLWPTNGKVDQSSSIARRPPGTILAERDQLARGSVETTVSLTRPGLLVLSASFDPGWNVTVDGARRRTLMVAPALVGVAVTAGTHQIVFTFRDDTDYSWLVILGVLPIIGLAVGAVRHRQRRESTRCAQRARGPRA